MDRRQAMQAGGLAAICGLFTREAKAQGYTITSVETRNMVLEEPNFSAEMIAHTTAPKAPTLSAKVSLTDFTRHAAGVEWTAVFELTGLTVIPPNEIPVKMHTVCHYGKMIDAELREVECTVTTTFQSGREHTAEYTPAKAVATMGKWPTDVNALNEHFKKRFAAEPYTQIFTHER